MPRIIMLCLAIVALAGVAGAEDFYLRRGAPGVEGVDIGASVQDPEEDPEEDPGPVLDDRSCWSILNSGFSTGDGEYEIDPDGEGGAAAFTVWCDMANGGFTYLTSQTGDISNGYFQVNSNANATVDLDCSAIGAQFRGYLVSGALFTNCNTWNLTSYQIACQNDQVQRGTAQMDRMAYYGDPNNICIAMGDQCFGTAKNAWFRYRCSFRDAPEPEAGVDATSCATILDTKPSAASGYYLVDPDGEGGNAAIPAYCDMTSRTVGDESLAGWTWRITQTTNISNARFTSSAGSNGSVSMSCSSVSSSLRPYAHFARGGYRSSGPACAGRTFSATQLTCANDLWPTDATSGTFTYYGHVPQACIGFADPCSGYTKTQDVYWRCR